MSDKLAERTVPIRLGELLAGPLLFATLFRESMALVQETARYLDGPGRELAKGLDRQAALAYAAESMRLTTRLMRLASWLLLHRALNEGDMSPAQASREKRKVKLAAVDPNEERTWRLLPHDLRDLIERAIALQERVQRLDASLTGDTSKIADVNQVVAQLGLLKAAFERPRP